MQVATNLWLRTGDLPPEFTYYVACAEMYHCTPSQLDEEDWFTVVDHLAIRDEIIKDRKR